MASAVILWPGVVASFASAYIMHKSLAHNEKFGPKSAAFRAETEKEATGIPPVNTSGEQNGGGATALRNDVAVAQNVV